MKKQIENCIKQLQDIGLSQYASQLNQLKKLAYKQDFQTEISTFEKLEQISNIIQDKGLYSVINDDIFFPGFELEVKNKKIIKEDESIKGFTKKAIIIGIYNYTKLFIDQYMSNKIDTLASFEQKSYSKLINEAEQLLRDVHYLKTLSRREVTKQDVENTIRKINTTESHIIVFRERALKFMSDKILSLEKTKENLEKTSTAIQRLRLEKIKKQIENYSIIKKYFEKYNLSEELDKVRTRIDVDFINEKKIQNKNEDFSLSDLRQIMKEIFPIHYSIAKIVNRLLKFAIDKDEDEKKGPKINLFDKFSKPPEQPESEDKEIDLTDQSSPQSSPPPVSPPKQIKPDFLKKPEQKEKKTDSLFSKFYQQDTKIKELTPEEVEALEIDEDPIENVEEKNLETLSDILINHIEESQYVTKQEVKDEFSPKSFFESGKKEEEKKQITREKNLTNIFKGLHSLSSTIDPDLLSPENILDSYGEVGLKNYRIAYRALLAAAYLKYKRIENYNITLSHRFNRIKRLFMGL